MSANTIYSNIQTSKLVKIYRFAQRYLIVKSRQKPRKLCIAVSNEKLMIKTIFCIKCTHK